MNYAPKDERIWQYRRMPDGSTEPRLFGSRREIPAGEGWADTRGAALGEVAVDTTVTAPNAFAELSVADQVAALEAAAASASTADGPVVDPDAPADPDAPHGRDIGGAPLAPAMNTDTAKPRKGGRKKKE